MTTTGSSTWLPPGVADVVLQQVHNSVVITDADFTTGGPHVIACNDAFLAMTGYELEELLGQNLRILQGPRTDADVIEKLRTCLREGLVFEGSTVNYRKDGSPYDVHWSISAVRDASGRVTHYVSVQQDITARVRAEGARHSRGGP